VIEMNNSINQIVLRLKFIAAFKKDRIVKNVIDNFIKQYCR